MRLWGRKSKSSGWGDADRTYVQRHLDFGSVRPTDWDEDPEPPKRSWFSRSNRAAQDEHEYYDHADGPQRQQAYEGAWDNESQPVDQHHRGGPDDRTRYDTARQKLVSFRNLIKCAAVGTVVTGLWLGSTLFYYTLKFPDPQSMGSSKQTPVLRILARDGSLLAERGGSHPYMPLQLLPKHVIDAVIAIEDRNFFNHWGVDPVGLTRAALVNMRVGRFVQGGSTITQQLAKNLFLSSERTMTRKLDELTLALWLETRLSKSDIIELYLNRVYFGSGSYGIESATQRYFGKSARALTVSEAAIIAGLLKAPSRLSPVSNPGLARKRGRLVLSRMLDIGVLSADAYTAAKNHPIRFHRSKPKRTVTGTEYAVDFIL
ncbi:MAG: transglycosylase domain-containing protein, partial [Pseudomonadota bacterium]